MKDDLWMDAALREAAKAERNGDVPIGAVVVKGDEILGRGHNRVERRKNAVAHAEIMALEAASRKLGDWRLDGCTVYVTVEPCHMCLGAMLLARVSRLVFGARQPRSGACGSVDDFHLRELLGHRIEVVAGVRESESAALLKSFFDKLRSEDRRRRDARAG